MPAYFLFVYFLMFGTSRGLLFNVTRGVQDLNWQDLFSNLDSSAKCPNKQSSPDAGKTWCQERKGECSSQGCCICKCEYPSATFQMNAKTCVGNSVIRSFAGKVEVFVFRNSQLLYCFVLYHYQALLVDHVSSIDQEHSELVNQNFLTQNPCYA